MATKEELYEALQRFIDGKHTLHVPPLPTDEDVMFSAAINELSRLREENEQLKEDTKAARDAALTNWERSEKFEADLAAARTVLAGRTYYHSDKAVEDELAALKALIGPLTRKEWGGLLAVGTKLNEQERELATVKAERDAFDRAHLIAYKRGMLRAAEIAREELCTGDEYDAHSQICETCKAVSRIAANIEQEVNK